MATQLVQSEQEQSESEADRSLTGSVTVARNEIATEAPAANEVRIGRRTFTAKYRQSILAQAAACKHGELGLLLRKEGLYHGQLNAWRKQMTQQAAVVPASSKRGRKPTSVNPLQAEVDRLNRELKRSSERLKQAEAIIALQKKVSEMLGLMQTAEVL